MHKDVKLCSDNNDIKGLRYIFVDSLDVDPTFEKYAEDFEYCRNLTGLFDDHIELSPLTMDENQWNSAYWGILKSDLLKNFSLKRFQHMQRVAKVVYAEKVRRLSLERRKNIQSVSQKSQTNDLINESVTVKKPATDIRKSTRTLEETVAKQNEERMRDMVVANQKFEEEKRKEERRMQQRERDIKRQEESDKNVKKVMGIVLAVIVIFIVILILI